MYSLFTALNVYLNGMFGLSFPRSSVPSPHKSFNQLNLPLFKVQSLMIMCTLLSMVYGLFEPC